MKRVLALAGILVFLAGCSSGNRELDRAMEFRDKLLKAEGCRFQAEVTADYGDSLCSFTMDCEGDASGNLTFSLTLPETIAGITGKITDSGGALTFDDTALHFDLLADGQLTPVSAPWIFLKTLRSGYLSSVCMEEDLLHVTADDSYADDALTLDIWLDGEDRPVRAEVLYGGKRILSLNVENFALL